MQNSHFKQMSELKMCYTVCIFSAQTYGLNQLLQKCIDFVRCKCFTELQKDPYFKRLEPRNLIHILQLRVLDLESTIEQVRGLCSAAKVIVRYFFCFVFVISSLFILLFCVICQSIYILMSSCLVFLRCFRIYSVG